MKTTSHQGFSRRAAAKLLATSAKTAELAELLVMARDPGHVRVDRPLPQQNSLYRSVVKLMIEDYEAGASSYELAARYNVRRNTVRDTLRRAGFTAKATRTALTEEQKAVGRASRNHDDVLPTSNIALAAVLSPAASTRPDT